MFTIPFIKVGSHLLGLKKKGMFGVLRASSSVVNCLFAQRPALQWEYLQMHQFIDPPIDCLSLHSN